MRVVRGRITHAAGMAVLISSKRVTWEEGLVGDIGEVGEVGDSSEAVVGLLTMEFLLLGSCTTVFLRPKRPFFSSITTGCCAGGGVLDLKKPMLV